MDPIRSNPNSRLLALACALLLALASAGCGDPTPEEQLADATQELTSASQAKQAAQTALDQLERRLTDAQAARDKAAEAFEVVRQRWAEAVDAVGEFATDEVLHRQVNRALLEEPDLEGATITAGVEERIVTLIGGAPDADAVALATELAGAIPGVANVLNEIIIQSDEEENGKVAQPEAALGVIPALPSIEGLDEPADAVPNPETHL